MSEWSLLEDRIVRRGAGIELDNGSNEVENKAKGHPSSCSLQQPTQAFKFTLIYVFSTFLKNSASISYYWGAKCNNTNGLTTHAYE